MGKNDNPREKLARWLTGYWEYECHTDLQSPPFDGGETGRGGRIRIEAEDKIVCVAALAQAFRLWIVEKAPGGEHIRTPLKSPIQWQTTHGGVWVADGNFLFSYSAHSDDGEGRTTDTYVLKPDSMTIDVGRFEHWRRDGQKVTGSVQLLPMVSWRSFTLAPKGCIIPPVVVVSDAPSSHSQPHAREARSRTTSAITHIGDVAGNVVVAAGPGATANQHLNDASLQIKSIDRGDVRQVIEAVLSDAERETTLNSTQRAYVADAVKDLVIELKDPKRDKNRALKWVAVIKDLLPQATSVVELADKVKSLFV